MRGKIIKGIAGFYYVHDGISRVYECKAKGIFRNQKIKPLVGDDVEFDVLDQQEGTGNIIDISPRSSCLIRPAVANVDQAVVSFAITQPAPNLNLLDRFLIMMERQELPVFLLFTKTDLSDQKDVTALREIYEPAGYSMCFISTFSDQDIQSVRDLIRGKTTVLAGPSGVGKSSLINQLQPKACMETGEISEKIQRGKHTTRHSELFFIEENTFMMDTPGFSSMNVEDMEALELKSCFPEFLSFEEECRFLSCAHVGEPVCGVKDAVKTGKISQCRYDNYVSIYQEIKNKRRY